jgi:histidinol phosphatase-like enzyme
MVRYSKKAVFLDRDGVLNFGILKNGKSYAPVNFSQFKLYPKIKIILKNLKEKVSN